MTWQKGTPSNSGTYFVTVNNGYDRWTMFANWDGAWFGIDRAKNEIDSSFIVAWMELPSPCEE